MLIHKFFAMKKENIDFDKIEIGVMDKTLALAYVNISDDFILDSAWSLGEKNALFTSSLDGRKGLNYYGVTVLSGEEILNFIASLNRLTDSKEKELLLKISNFAIESECCLVHFGV